MVSSVYGWCRPYTDGVVRIRTASLVYGRRHWYTDGVVGIRTASLVYGRRRWYTDGVVRIRMVSSVYGRRRPHTDDSFNDRTQHNKTVVDRTDDSCVVLCSVLSAKLSSGRRPGVVRIRTASSVYGRRPVVFCCVVLCSNVKRA